MSVPTADKRPAQLHQPHASEASRHASGVAQPQTRPVASGILDIDERSTKRRKVEGVALGEKDATSPIATTGPTGPRYTNLQDLRLLAAIVTAKYTGDANRPDPKDVALPLMPAHPWRDRVQKKPPPERKQTHRARSQRQVPRTPDTLSPPKGGPTLVGERPAGYFPWGARPSAEDQLSDINVKQGFSDRPPNPPEKELNTARVPLYTAFKHKSGLESLSTIFSIVLEAKTKHNMLDSLSSFKPPPRVTLSEPKKRTWIGELADPTVPLKKLSRTIPQGIRGQGLLEQCLQNAVPLNRALWFVKCVGANEIRTLKRKGTTQAVAAGGERAWLKDWTVNIEQFIEAVLNQNGQPSWKQNLQYALRLTTRLYLENLVDRDHFLDWIVSTFATTGHDRIPFWLMMAHLFKLDIAKFRKRGRRMAELLVRRYLVLKESNNTMVQTIVLKLKEAIRGFALYRPQLFLAPDVWPELQDALKACLRSDHGVETRLLERLDLVNERCMGANKQQYHVKPNPRDTMVDILDATTVPSDIDKLSLSLFALSADFNVLVPAVAEWATTRYRYGTERVYLASRLLRKWQKTGMQIDAALLDFVAKCHDSPELFDSAALRHLAAELSRAKAFPTSKYMQWLSVRGLPWPKSVVSSQQTDPRDARQVYVRQTCKDSSQLLADILFSEAESRHLNLRNALLSRAGFDTDLEYQTTQRLQAIIRLTLQQSGNGQDKTYSTKQLTTLLSGWNWRIRSTLAHGVRNFVVTKVKQQANLRRQGVPLQDNGISLQHFEVIRTCLEALGDETILADVVGLCYQTYDEGVQGALVNTAHRHARALSAIGALEPLQTRLCQNYLSLRNVNTKMPLFATALFDFCTAYPCKLGSLKLLQSDLVRGDRNRSVSACSPFSDGIAESLQNAAATFIEEFEAVLQSEPSMNEQTMSRLFALLQDRIEKQTKAADSEILFAYCQLMARLRLCRKQQGDQLLRTWLVKLLQMNPTGFAQTLVSCLMDVGALSVEALVASFAGHKLAAPILQHMFPDQLPEQRYSVSSKWIEYSERKPQQLLNLTCQLPRNASFDIDTLCLNAVLKADEEPTKAAQIQVRRFLNELLERGTGGDVSASLEAMDVFSLSFVRLHLQLSSTVLDSGLADSIVNAVAKGSVDNIAKLLHATQSGLAGQVRQIVDDNILEMLPSASQGKLLDVSLDLERMERLQQAVDQAFLLFPPTSTPSVKNMSHLVEKLQQFLKFLSSATPSLQAASPSAVYKQAVASPVTPSLSTPTISSHLLQPSSPMEASLRTLPSTIVDYFRILLKLLCLQRPVAPPNKDSPIKPQSHPDHIKILVYVAHIASHPAFVLPTMTFPDSPQVQHRTREAVDFAFDVLATYVDDLSDESRATCAKILKDRLSSPADGPLPTLPGGGSNSAGVNIFSAIRESQSKLKWLFGSVNAMGSDLPNAAEMGAGLLVTKRGADGKPVGNNTGTAAGMTPTSNNAAVGSTQSSTWPMSGNAASGTPSLLPTAWKPRIWEVLECHGRPDGETSLGLGLFGARRPRPMPALGMV